MPKKYYGPKYEKEQKRMRDLQREVLQHLKEHGKKNYEMLYVWFDQQRTGDIGPALHDLLQWEHIKRTKDDDVEITASGLQLLEDKNF